MKRLDFVACFPPFDIIIFPRCRALDLGDQSSAGKVMKHTRFQDLCFPSRGCQFDSGITIGLTMLSFIFDDIDPCVDIMSMHVHRILGRLA